MEIFLYITMFLLRYFKKFLLALVSKSSKSFKIEEKRAFIKE